MRIYAPSTTQARRTNTHLKDTMEGHRSWGYVACSRYISNLEGLVPFTINGYFLVNTQVRVLVL